MQMPVAQLGMGDTQRDGLQGAISPNVRNAKLPQKGMALFLLGSMLPEQ